MVLNAFSESSTVDTQITEQASSPVEQPLVSASVSPRVLLADENLPFRRVIREALTAFRVCEVDDAPSGERAFEMALHREYSLFLFSWRLPDMEGVMLDRLLGKAYPVAHRGAHTAPPVIFLVRPEDSMSYQSLQRDVRVRGCMPLPPKLDILLSLTSSMLPGREAPIVSFPTVAPSRVS